MKVYGHGPRRTLTAKARSGGDAQHRPQLADGLGKARSLSRTDRTKPRPKTLAAGMAQISRRCLDCQPAIGDRSSAAPKPLCRTAARQATSMKAGDER